MKYLVEGHILKYTHNLSLSSPYPLSSLAQVRDLKWISSALNCGQNLYFCSENSAPLRFVAAKVMWLANSSYKTKLFQISSLLIILKISLQKER